MNRDAIAVEIIKAILAGRSYVMPLRINDVSEHLDEWVKMAYMIADKCLKISVKEAK